MQSLSTPCNAGSVWAPLATAKYVVNSYKKYSVQLSSIISNDMAIFFGLPKSKKTYCVLFCSKRTAILQQLTRYYILNCKRYLKSHKYKYYVVMDSGTRNSTFLHFILPHLMFFHICTVPTARYTLKNHQKDKKNMITLHSTHH